MLPLILAAINLPAHVAGPVPGEITVIAGVARSLPAFEVRLPVARWLRLDSRLEAHPQAPLLGAELLMAADGRHGPLQAHAFAGADLRPVLGDEILSGARLSGGLGVTAHFGALIAVAEGGATLGLAFNPVRAARLSPDEVDQQGGLFLLQRLSLGFDLLDRFQLAGTAAIALPLDSVATGQGEQALPTAVVRLGAQLAVRF